MPEYGIDTALIRQLDMENQSRSHTAHAAPGGKQLVGPTAMEQQCIGIIEANCCPPSPCTTTAYGITDRCFVKLFLIGPGGFYSHFYKLGLYETRLPIAVIDLKRTACWPAYFVCREAEYR